MTKRILIPLLSLTLLWMNSCQMDRPIAGENEAWEDEAEFKEARSYQDKIPAVVFATVETHPMPEKVGDDAADDPAIWIHPTLPELSLLLGTNKKGGLAVYSLDGKEVAYYPLGTPNNVDVRYGFPLQDKKVDLAGFSDRSINGFRIVLIDSTGQLTEAEGGIISCDTAFIDEAYGFCLYHHSQSSQFYAFLNGKNGKIGQYHIQADSNGQGLNIQHIRTLEVPSQPEGMVADDEMGVLYAGEEGAGIWRFPAIPGDGDLGRKIHQSSMNDNPDIRYDIEGLALYYAPEGQGYLIASSQGSFSYAVFKREAGNAYVGSFKILDGEKADGAEETDGLEVVNVSLGSSFPFGVLIVQDGFNFEGDSLASQNFKLIPWEQVHQALELQIPMAPEYRQWMGGEASSGF